MSFLSQLVACCCPRQQCKCTGATSIAYRSHLRWTPSNSVWSWTRRCGATSWVGEDPPVPLYSFSTAVEELIMGLQKDPVSTLRIWLVSIQTVKEEGTRAQRQRSQTTATSASDLDEGDFIASKWCRVSTPPCFQWRYSASNQRNRSSLLSCLQVQTGLGLDLWTTTTPHLLVAFRQYRHHHLPLRHLRLPAIMTLFGAENSTWLMRVTMLLWILDVAALLRITKV